MMNLATGKDYQSVIFLLKDSDGRPVAEQWLVEGGGHAWFGGDPRGSFTQTVRLDASRVMVRFFLAE